MKRNYYVPIMKIKSAFEKLNWFLCNFIATLQNAIKFYESQRVFPRPSNIPLWLCVLMTPVFVINLTLSLNSYLKKFETWLQGIKLLLNVAKIHLLLTSTKPKGSSIRSRNEALEMKTCDNKLQVVQKTEYLRMQIHCFLDWKEQIKAVSTKVSRVISFLIHAKSFLPFVNLKTPYNGILEPHFRYYCSV